MATRASRPVRTLTIFLLVLIGMFAWCAAIGEWKPKLGLDLQGGQRITLKASTTTGGSITEDKLNEAADIISQRVNGAGVAEAEVSTQGRNIIVVEVPGKATEGLADQIGSTAQLRFRLQSLVTGPATTDTQGTPEGTTPTEPEPSASGDPQSDSPESSPESGSPSSSAPTDGETTGKNRAGAAWMQKNPKAPAATTTAPADEDPTGAEATGGDATGGVPPALVPPQLEPKIKDPLAWVQAPPQVWQQRLQEFDCDKRNPALPGQADLPDQPLLACDEAGNRYLLGPSMVSGTDVTDASYGIPQNALGGAYAVNVEFNDQGSKDFADVTRSIAGVPDPNSQGDQMRLAIVLDGEMLSNPSNDEAITGGRAEITGNFTEQEAKDLSNSLKYGALPLAFSVEAESNEGPELASNQLTAGIIAGVIGLILVMIYCILYYRALSIVIIASLLIAGLMTYASVLLLSHGYGFTLTLPGIAGLIVAIGVTADSFIVYFERLRDEVREGRTLKTSVETGWARARNTILAADAISFLAAVILFIFAIGVVKGFAFALGLSTVIDVFIVFFFTKPMVTLLARTKFFGNGHKLSGLDREHLGLPPLPKEKATPKKQQPQPVGGEA